jgi:single-strand DNA-binding protein
MNLFAFSGNIGRDCEVRTTQSGASVASFSVAVNSGYGDKKKTTWVRCLLFGKRAEGGLIQYLTKGTQVEVTGELSVSEWSDKTSGENKYQVEVVVSTVGLIGGRSGGESSVPNPPQTESDVPF